MELNYRKYVDHFDDEGLEVIDNLGSEKYPDFYNRNTIQVWNVSAVSNVEVGKWIGSTLSDRTSHEITIVNNSSGNKTLTFSNSYILPDSNETNEQIVRIGPNGTAHFYATASFYKGNLVFTMRKGSQDKRNL